jgi:hypothetical protein
MIGISMIVSNHAKTKWFESRPIHQLLISVIFTESREEFWGKGLSEELLVVVRRPRNGKAARNPSTNRIPFGCAATHSDSYRFVFNSFRPQPMTYSMSSPSASQRSSSTPPKEQPRDTQARRRTNSNALRNPTDKTNRPFLPAFDGPYA